MTQIDQKQLEQKMITIASGKGGVGKTWLATTLAHTLSRMGRKVLLFDGDIGLANIDIQLGLIPERDLGDFIANTFELNQCIMTYNDPAEVTGKLDVLPGKSGSGALGSISQNKLNDIKSGLTALAANYDHVLLDLSAGIDAGVTTLARHRGPIIVVLTADPTSLTDAYAFIKLSIQRDPTTDIRIVVNMVSSNREGEKTYQALNRACEGFLKFSPPLIAIIRRDKFAVDAIRHQVPLLVRHPQSPAAGEVMELARKFPIKTRAMAG